jgi:hypothetical protein
MKNKKIILGLIFLAILGFSCWIFWDDLDNFITGINAQPIKIISLVGEIGTSLSNEGRIYSSYISPAKLEINNAFRGANPEFVLKVKNGTNNAITYSISVRDPDILEEGYSIIPLSWIILEDKEIVVLARETKEVPIVINIPKHLPSKKLMFWVSVKGKSSGMMKMELCSKVMVNIR